MLTVLNRSDVLSSHDLKKTDPTFGAVTAAFVSR